LDYGKWKVSKLKNDDGTAIARFNCDLKDVLTVERFPNELVVTAYPPETSDLDEYLNGMNDIEDEAMSQLLACEGCEMYLTITDASSREMYFALSGDLGTYVEALNTLAEKFPNRVSADSRETYLGLYNSAFK